MTADASIVVESVSDALLVPNVALRFSPPEALLDDTKAQDGAIADTGSDAAHVEADGSIVYPQQSGVWILGVDGTPKRILTSVGLTDDRFSEIKDGPLNVGDLVLVGVDGVRNGNRGKKLPPWLR